jgi:hypothetical protein
MPASLGVRSLQYGSPVNGAAPLNRDLVAWWRVLPLRSGGRYWRDLVRGLPATLNGMGASSATSGWGAPTSAGSTGEMRFDGTNDYLALPPTLSLVGGEYTFMCLVRGGITGGAFLFDNLYQGGTARNVVSLAGGNWAGNTRALSVLVPGGGTFNLGATNSIPATGCHHIAVVYSVLQNTILGYVNGSATGSSGSYTDSYGGANIGFQVGTRDSASAQWLTGALDDLRFYERALSPSEVWAYYLATRQGCRQELNWQVWPPLVVKTAGGILRQMMQHGS